MNQVQYHPDLDINKKIQEDVLQGEIKDLESGFLPRRWECTCGAEHSRGNFMSIGVHRCLNCGYVGEDGILL